MKTTIYHTTVDHQKVSKWFVWNSQERHFTRTYEEAWKLSESLYFNTGRTTVVEPVYSL